MPRLSLGLGVQSLRRIKAGGAAPSGINVANTDSIALSGLTVAFVDLNGTYIKSGDPTNVFNGGVNGNATGAVYFNQDYIGGNRNGAAIWYGPISFGSGNGWQITYYDDNDLLLGSIVSADTTTIPISGYSNDAGYTGTITLTKGAYASSSINFNFEFAGLSDAIGKASNTVWSNSIGGSAFTLTWNSVVANQWALDCDGAGSYPAARATNANGGNSQVIPIDGWSYVIGEGQSIVLTPFFP